MKTVTVAAAVLVEAGRVLLTQRKAGGHLPGMWEFPGGKVETGEDPRDALRRELHEELGIVATVGEVVDVTFHRYEDDDKAVLLLFFEAARTATSPEPRALDVAALEWASEARLSPDRFPPADVAVLAKVRARCQAHVRHSAPPPSHAHAMPVSHARPPSVAFVMPPEAAVPRASAPPVASTPGSSPAHALPASHGEPPSLHPSSPLPAPAPKPAPSGAASTASDDARPGATK